MREDTRFKSAHAPRLRLVRDDDALAAPPLPAARGDADPRALEVVRENRLAAHAGAIDAQAIDAHDPRWALALQTQARLQGAVLTPERRGELMRSGQQLGLRAFESNLVIAVVQDQARRQQPRTMAQRTIGLVGLPAAPVATVAAALARRHSPWLASLIAATLVAAGIIIWLLTAVEN